MVTKGIITSIDFNGNTCQVRIPFFETAGNDPIIGTAVVSNTPGSYNGYKVGDVVLVAFEDGQMETPVVIGKLYLGAEKEKADPRGSLNTESLVAAKTAAVPADTKLTTNTDKNLPNTMNPYANLSSIANNLNKLNTDVNYLDAFTNNQFSSVITDVNKQGDELRSEIKQTAENIENKVVHKHQDGSQKALGWDLTTDSWKINAQDTVNGEVKNINIVTIDRSGMSIAGDLKLSGYPKNTTVLYAQNNSDKNYPTPLYNFTEVEFPVPFPSGDEDKDKTWYYGKYIKIEENYVLIFKENFEHYKELIDLGTTKAYSREINSEWKTETPKRVDGQYIWQWTHTEIYSFDGNKWTEQDDDKITCITGADGKDGTPGKDGAPGKDGYTTVTVMLYKRSKTSLSDNPISDNLYYKFSDQKLYKDNAFNEEYKLPTGWSYTINGAGSSSNGDLYCIAALANSNTDSDSIPASKWVGPTLYVENGTDGKPGISIKEAKQWYILWSANASTNPTKLTNNIEPTEPADPSTVESWMSTPPEAVNGYIVWTCYGSIFSDDTPESRHIEYSDPVKDNAYALAQGKTTNYYSDTDPSKVYSVKKGDCWFKTISSTNSEYNKDATGQNQGKLYQCSGFDTDGKAIWEDVGGELVANKLTANYINALDITAKKITVLDKSDNNKPLFEADGINGTGNVSIANFTVKNDKLYSGDHDEIGSTKAGIYLGSKGLSIGSNFKITTGVDGTDPKIAIAGYTKSVEKKYCRVGFAVVTADNKPDWWDDWNDANWSDIPPDRQDGSYIWEWTKTTSTTDTDTDNTKDTKVCITGAKGDPGKDGTNGLSPYIGQNGNWWIGENDTGIKAEGLDGQDGHTPEVTIGENGNWYIDGKDTGVLAKGTPGDPGKTGRSVLSVTKFYKTATSKPNKPSNKTPADWYTSPPAWKTGNNYYESDLTIYDSTDSTGQDYSWSDVIENSMLTVDFINSLGISAQGLRVVDEHENLILSANIADDDTKHKVKIGGFSLSTNEFKTTRTEGTGDNSWDAADVLITNADQTYKSKVANQDRTDWRLLVGEHFGVNSAGGLYCDIADVKGNIIATSGRLENIDIIKSGYLASTQIQATDLNTNNLDVANEASIAGFKLKSATTESATTDSKEVSLKIITRTDTYVSDIGTYIGGSWLFKLTFACYDGDVQQSFISQHNFTNYKIYSATFESDEMKTVGTGSDTSTTHYLTKIYFNNASLTAYKGQSTITATVSGGGGGASQSSKWKLKEVAIYVNGNLKNLSYFNGGSDSAKVTIDYLTTTSNSNLLLDGGIAINGNVIPYNDNWSIGDSSHKWNTLYVNNAYATAFYASSDKRLKENIKEFEPKNSILNLPVVEFDFKDSNIHQIGCIAQDLQKICPELVTTNADGYLSISENKLSYLLLLELKKLNNRVTELEQKLIEKDTNK